MKERQIAHVAVLRSKHAEPLGSGHRMKVGIGRHHALGWTGRTRGVDNRLHIPRSDAGGRQARLVALIQHARRNDLEALDGDGIAFKNHHRLDLCGLDLGQQPSQAGMCNDNTGAGILENVLEQMTFVRRVDRNVSRAQPIDANQTRMQSMEFGIQTMTLSPCLTPSRVSPAAVACRQRHASARKLPLRPARNLDEYLDRAGTRSSVRASGAARRRSAARDPGVRGCRHVCLPGGWAARETGASDAQGITP